MNLRYSCVYALFLKIKKQVICKCVYVNFLYYFFLPICCSHVFCKVGTLEVYISSTTTQLKEHLTDVSRVHKIKSPQNKFSIRITLFDINLNIPNQYFSVAGELGVKCTSQKKKIILEEHHCLFGCSLYKTHCYTTHQLRATDGVVAAYQQFYFL